MKSEIRLYEHLFLKENPDDVEEGHDFKENINPNSLQIKTCFVEKCLNDAKIGEIYQFERLGYFYVDPDSTTNSNVFNRTVTLKDSWQKTMNTK